jgi:hypothetical protein
MMEKHVEGRKIKVVWLNKSAEIKFEFVNYSAE